MVEGGRWIASRPAGRLVRSDALGSLVPSAEVESLGHGAAASGRKVRRTAAAHQGGKCCGPHRVRNQWIELKKRSGRSAHRKAFVRAAPARRRTARSMICRRSKPLENEAEDRVFGRSTFVFERRCPAVEKASPVPRRCRRAFFAPGVPFAGRRQRESGGGRGKFPVRRGKNFPPARPDAALSRRRGFTSGSPSIGQIGR